MARAARSHGVPLGVLYAVGLSETGRKGVLHPYALNIDGRTLRAADLRQAVAEFNGARSRGAKLVDLGCMQINHLYHGAQFSSVEAMFDPVRNVDYAARFLKELRAREGNWTMAVARYNAGPNNVVAQRRYVCGVIGHLVASGFGSWTDKARAFCATRDSDSTAGRGASLTQAKAPLMPSTQNGDER
ncbi:transglycosylase SLT domain-containing protein [Bradyrhizobium sp. U87765 SZCCT0131]|nr:transglycosylase SLT domain-containing protein [Bradyrhizobium sp. U87765 SZCCT0131]MBR1259872.1 transglycosylase SLT domain-containing protein [Bradyrhizobium sp. U87765 SZCCT0134]MBR1306005.1 transglycosylase SLT domain-containing protein [Bradyrhizobium sp. U87765 SZCCT0110]MBR1322372.1 transglycosylase SLT domain-containing protein [Bradyrhizobium sp. U87765 SZCCT0109]MBR1352337.1 transglycosylase SLT domain-containing protein [Bradyrhizobium sp. U87765 SZCCT0048]